VDSSRSQGGRKSWVLSLDQGTTKLSNNNMEGRMSEEVTKAILARSEPPDVTVSCGPLTLSLHSFVLATDSKFFATMLDAPMVERESRKVTVKDVEPEVFEKVVGFMYTKKLSFHGVSQLEEMLESADRFDMEELKERIGRDVARGWPWRFGSYRSCCRCVCRSYRICWCGCKETCDLRNNLVTTAILAEHYNAEDLFKRSVERMVTLNIRPEEEELTKSHKLEMAVIEEYTVKFQKEVSDVKYRRRQLKGMDDGILKYFYIDSDGDSEYIRRRAQMKKLMEELDDREKEAAMMMEGVVLMAFAAWRHSVPDF